MSGGERVCVCRCDTVIIETRLEIEHTVPMSITGKKNGFREQVDVHTDGSLKGQPYCVDHATQVSSREPMPCPSQVVRPLCIVRNVQDNPRNSFPCWTALEVVDR